MGAYFVRSGSRVSGPFATREVREMAASGTLLETDEVSKDKVRWVRAREIDGLVFRSAVLQRISPPPPAAAVRPESPTPIASPFIQMHASPVIQVNAPARHGNSLGIASMVLGILAFVICWIPILNLLGLPLSGLGLLLGIIGIIISATRGGSGIGFPIAGTAIAFVALVVVLWMYATLAQALAPAGVQPIQPALPAAPSTPRNRTSTTP